MQGLPWGGRWESSGAMNRTGACPGICKGLRILLGCYWAAGFLEAERSLQIRSKDSGRGKRKSFTKIEDNKLFLSLNPSCFSFQSLLLFHSIHWQTSRNRIRKSLSFEETEKSANFVSFSLKCSHFKVLRVVFTAHMLTNLQTSVHSLSTCKSLTQQNENQLPTEP